MPSKDLNESQRRAVFSKGSHLLIVAGPGTGKTHTLTHRIANLAQQLESYQRILAITFTNKAADEMRQRLTARLNSLHEKVYVGTFHGFCLDLLRQYGEEAQIKEDFKVATPEEIQTLVTQLWPGASVKERNQKLEKISLWKSRAVGKQAPEEVIVYNQFLRQSGFLDFDDLLVEAFQLLENHQFIKDQMQNRYRFVCVDEYQDINPIQHALLKMLAGDHGQMTAIGDPNQSIYGFRGSDVQFFDSFATDFPEAQIMHLSENYRSGAQLLKAAGQVIQKSDFQVPELIAKIYKEGKLTIFEAATEKAEAEYVVHTIEKMVGGTSMFSQDSGRVENHHLAESSFGDIVVLYRLNAQKYALEKAFSRSGIPYQVSGEKIGEDSVNFSMEKVNLMTLHAGKGLEFPTVFIVGCENGLIPLKIKGLDSVYEEERRLFYVGMTRAKEHLFLIRAKRRLLYGKVLHLASSPFLADIEEHLKEYEKNPLKPRNQSHNQEQQLSFFK